MDENENKPSETSEEANDKPSRDEILASSREENKQGDEREKNLYSKGTSLAYGVGIILLGVISLVNVIVTGKTPIELWIVYMGMTAVWTFFYGIKVGKRRPLFLACGVICSIDCVFSAVMWILGLCGVVL